MPQAPPHRKHLRRREAPSQPRFLTFSCNQQLPLLADPGVKDALAQKILNAKKKHRFQLYAWVIMPEHVHLLLCPDLKVATTEQTLSLIKSRFARDTFSNLRAAGSPWIDKATDGKGKSRFWQAGGGFDRNIRDEEEFWRTVRYINSNPVKRGLIEHASAYRWSSARWWMDRSADLIGIDHPRYSSGSG